MASTSRSGATAEPQQGASLLSVTQSKTGAGGAGGANIVRWRRELHEPADHVIRGMFSFSLAVNSVSRVSFPSVQLKTRRVCLCFGSRSTFDSDGGESWFSDALACRSSRNSTFSLCLQSRCTLAASFSVFSLLMPPFISSVVSISPPPQCWNQV